MCDPLDCGLYRQKLKKQIIDAHARVEYTYTAHHKIENRKLLINRTIRSLQAILTAISSGGFLATITTKRVELSWIGGVSAAISLGLTLVSMDFKFEAEAMQHKAAADALWDVREEYVSLIADIDELNCADIVKKRNSLKEEVSRINKQYPGTDKIGYKTAQKALQQEEEQTFNEGEAERFLPEDLID